MNSLIKIQDCSVQGGTKKYLNRVDWCMNAGEAWLVIGPNGGGKADFIKALSGSMQFVPNIRPANEINGGSEAPLYSSRYSDSVAVVSLEAAASLIEEERERDESEYMDKEDAGRTGRQYICEVLGGSSKKNAPLPPIAARLETMPQVKLCGIEKILDRGLRYMSTGEIRRTLLCRALLSGAGLLVLSDPFAGLDAASRAILLEFFDSIVRRQLDSSSEDSGFPRIILSMERFHEIPSAINRVIEFSNKKISFEGSREEYENVLAQRQAASEKEREVQKAAFRSELDKIRAESKIISGCKVSKPGESLIKFTDVNVGWDDHLVLENLSWEVKAGEHWCIRGPNGSGKTTILELITGDNMQVFREDIKLFGNRRGSGESIWDIKKRLGIVSYRLHVEYRMVGGTSLENTIISGFKDIY